MFTLVSVHHPLAEHREALIGSMHRYADAIRGLPGLVTIHTFEDSESDRLVGLAIFESEDAFRRLAPLARAAVADDPFEEWEQRRIDVLRLTEV